MTSPNFDQILSIIRWLLSVGGPVGALLISKGIPPESVTTFSTSLLAILGALPPVISFVWGMLAHTDTAKLKSVEALPEVKQIVVKSTATPTSTTTAAEVAVADPARPKVVATTNQG